MNNIDIGSRLKEARKLRRLSQDALAQKIGTSRGVITNIEHHKVREPHAMVVNAICDALGIRSQWLVEGQEPMEIEENPSKSSNDVTVPSSEHASDAAGNGAGKAGSTAGETDVTAEINAWVQTLPVNDQLYILETIKAYVAHRNKE